MDNKSLETQAHSLLGSILSSANPKIVIKCYFWYFGIKTFKLNNKKKTYSSFVAQNIKQFSRSVCLARHW